MADPAAAPTIDARAAVVELAEDPGAKRRHEIAMGAAFLLNAVMIALFLVRVPPESFVTETTIPVEVVTLAAAEPEPEPEPEPEAQTEPEVQPEPPPAPPPPQENYGESGGDPELSPGKTEEAAVPKSVPAPLPKPEPPAAETKAPEPAPPPEQPNSDAGLATPPPEPATAPQQAALTAPPAGTSATQTNPSMVTGEGGGDPYLNALRDTVIAHLIFPASDELVNVSGTAQYQITVDRQGRLLEIELVRSAGNALLDRAGFNSIKRAAPFGPLPDKITGDQVGIRVVLFMKPFS